MIDKIAAAGHVVILGRVSYFHGQNAPLLPLSKDYNAAIDEPVTGLLAVNGLLRPPPDFYSYFVAHPKELSDGAHPSPTGSISMCRIWADAVAPLYRGSGSK